jgi:hypothetical protein
VIYIEEPPAVDMPAVLADDHLVEVLRLGRTPANAGPLVTMLAAWRDLCRAATTHQVL